MIQEKNHLDLSTSNAISFGACGEVGHQQINYKCSQYGQAIIWQSLNSNFFC